MKELSRSFDKLDESLSSLEAFFTDTAGTPRFIALLSPTCPGCTDGADAVQDTILEANDTDLAVAIIWIPMLDGDTPNEIEQASRRFADYDITQFVDTDRIAGAHIAKTLGATNGIAWDIYLFYTADEQWETGGATPHDWVHQLSPCSWAPAERMRCGDDLKTALRQQAHQIIENQ